jgi:hypothetical protein
MVRADGKIMSYKILSCLAGSALLCLTSIGLAKDDLPKTEPFSHYAPMVKRSPFAVASATGPVGGTPDFAKNLYVANAAHAVDGDYVTIASTVDKNLKEYLTTREPVDGYSISNIQWSDRVGETKVTISKDGQFATLTFNEALLSQAIPSQPGPVAQAPPMPPVPGRPPVTPHNPNMPVQRPMPVPQIPTPAPHTRPTIRRQVPHRQVQPARQNLDDDDESDLPAPGSSR